MINGHMAEAQQGFAVLQEVDEATFSRFVQWAYHGFYFPAVYQKNAEEELRRKNPSVTNPAVVTPVKDAGAPPLVYKHKLKVRLSTSKPSTPKRKTLLSPSATAVTQSPCDMYKLKERFIKRKRTTSQAAPHATPPRPNKSATEDYTEVFLCHARLYIFAEKYDVQILKALAFEELHATIAIFTLFPQRTGDIIALLRYVYANTGDSVQGKEDIRTMLMAYVGYEMEVLIKERKFMEVMVEDGGAMLWDFMKTVEKRI